MGNKEAGQHQENPQATDRSNAKPRKATGISEADRRRNIESLARAGLTLSALWVDDPEIARSDNHARRFGF